MAILIVEVDHKVQAEIVTREILQNMTDRLQVATGDLKNMAEQTWSGQTVRENSSQDNTSRHIVGMQEILDNVEKAAMEFKRLAREIREEREKL